MSMNWIKDELKKRAMSIADLSRVTGLSDRTITNMLNGIRTPRYQTVRAIARVLEIPIQKFMERCTHAEDKE